MKIKNCFLDDCVFLEIRLTHEKSIITQYNEKYMSNGIFKFVRINMKHLLYFTIWIKYTHVSNIILTYKVHILVRGQNI